VILIYSIETNMEGSLIITNLIGIASHLPRAFDRWGLGGLKSQRP
jgi:hypothetical protein